MWLASCHRSGNWASEGFQNGPLCGWVMGNGDTGLGGLRLHGAGWGGAPFRGPGIWGSRGTSHAPASSCDVTPSPHSFLETRRGEGRGGGSFPFYR